MRELVAEILLRFLKPLLAALLGMLLWVVLVGLAGAAPSAELALLCWLAAAAFILLAQESPL
jgi:hypothetical protein